MNDTAEAALKPLVGLPMTSVSRAGGMLMFGFGTLRSIPARNGQTREAGDFALHIQCSWRLRDISRILIGLRDVYYPADLPWNEPIPEGFDWDVAGENRCDHFFQSFMAKHSAQPIIATSVVVDSVGGFQLAFSQGYELDVFPDVGTPDEVWRLFRPGSSGHFVMRAHDNDPSLTT